MKGLYRGVSAPLLAVSPIYAISFWGYDIGQRMVKMMRKPGDDSQLSLMEISIAGGISGKSNCVTDKNKCTETPLDHHSTLTSRLSLVIFCSFANHR